MSERLPYEEQLQQQWNDLPLPDENAAWADMKKRLEEDDDDGGIVWWRRGCALWGLLLLLLLATGWWLLKPGKWFTDKKTTEQVAVKQQKDSAGNRTNDINTVTIPVAENDKQEQNTLQPTQPTGTNESANPETIKNTTINNESERKIVIKTIAGKRGVTGKTNILSEIKTTRADKKKKNKSNDDETNDNNEVKAGITKAEIEKEQKTTIPVDEKKHVTNVISDTSKVDPDKQTSVTDSAIAASRPDSIKKKVATVDIALTKTKPKKDSTKKNTYFFSAGIALQQQVPVAGQKATPYNALGRKGTLLDYIPSVYFRFNKTNKWFIQSEFKYGAPQYTKEFTYNQQSVRDSTGPVSFTTTTSLKLKKTFYHQLPLTFNYYALPNWSMGGGVVWNKFSSAISERDVTKRNNQTLSDSVLSKGTIKSNRDSAIAHGFSKSYFQAVFETQYQWKRFSIGARYAFGLQPYIKFTLPGGTQQREKNSSLQIFLRYELWKGPRH